MRKLVFPAFRSYSCRKHPHYTSLVRAYSELQGWCFRQFEAPFARNTHTTLRSCGLIQAY